ncbi:hypothetical protein A2U01_0035907, partial [Trifolium medium]|nr:hypothetical protein [Trifolium medium]
ARALISKLTEERNSAIEKYKRLEQELIIPVINMVDRRLGIEAPSFNTITWL